MIPWGSDERPAFVERVVEWTQAGVPLATTHVCVDTAWSGLLVGFAIGAGLVGMAGVFNRRLG